MSLKGFQAETCSSDSCSALVRAASRTARQAAFGRRRRSARRSRSVMPPHTPHSIWLSRASARHSVRTGHPVHSCLALFCSAPRTNSSSGCALRQAALGVQSSIHMSLPCHLRENSVVPLLFLGVCPGGPSVPSPWMKSYVLQERRCTGERFDLYSPK